MLKIPTIKISERYVTEIWVMSDVHFGHKNFDGEHFDIYMNWLAKGYHKMIGLGDYLESAYPGNAGGKMMWDQIMTPKEQLKLFSERLKPFKNKIVGLATGNHERRLRHDSSIDSAELLCELIGVPFLGYTGWLCLDSGHVQYYIHYHHGTGSSITAEYQLRKLENAGYHGTDIRIIGHGHCLAWLPKTHMLVNRDKRTVERRVTHEVRTGGFLKDPEYAVIKMFPVSSIGSPILRLHPKKKIVDVRMGLTEDGTYGFEDLIKEEE